MKTGTSQVEKREYARKRKQMTLELVGPSLKYVKKICKNKDVEYTRKGNNIFINPVDATKLGLCNIEFGVD